MLEKVMLDIMYDIPSSEDIAGVKITGAVVRGESKPVLRRKQNKAAA
jgi:ATP-dependent Clp protease ATP-binding subunit ClpX